MRHVRKQEVDADNTWIVEIERCHRCWDSAAKRVDTVRERHAIDRYLVRWRYDQGQPATIVEAQASLPQPEDKLAAALAASRERVQARETQRMAYQRPQGNRPPPLPAFHEEGRVKSAPSDHA